MKRRSILPQAAGLGPVLLATALLATPAAPSAAAGGLEIVSLAPGDAHERHAAPAEGKAPALARDPRGLVRLPRAPLGQGYVRELEPNGTVATAQA
jgi:hypothetical protein